MAQTCAQAIGAVALAALTSACASTGSVPRPFPTPPASTTSPAPESNRTRADPSALVGTALQLRGVPYRNGGATPDGFDCSGFTQYVFGRHGVALPRNVQEQFNYGRAVGSDEIRQGDLLFFAIEGPGASHVGIALGGDSFVHAPSTSGVVRVERFAVRYWSERFVGARRIN